MNDAAPQAVEEKVRQCCRLLCVDSDAPDREIKRAFHRAVRALHPDVTGNDRHSNERFKQVVEAYNYLYERARRHKARATVELKNPRTLTQGKLFSDNWARSAPPAAGPSGSGDGDGWLKQLTDRELILRIEASQNPLVRCEAVKLLGSRGGRENAWILLRCLDDPSLTVKRESVRALGAMRCKIAVTALKRLDRREGRRLAYEIQQALELIGSPMATRAVRRMTVREFG